MKKIWSLNTVNGTGSGYIKIPIAPVSNSNGYEQWYYSGENDGSDGPLPGTSDFWKIWPAAYSDSYEELFYRRWGFNNSINHEGTQAWNNITESWVEDMVVRPLNWQYFYDKADTGKWPHFQHTYMFYIDIPDLHTGTHAGKVQLHFGTGLPWSAYRSFNEVGPIQQVTYNVTVDNAG